MILVFFISPSRAISAPYQLISNVSNYGWLDQYSLNSFFPTFVGDEACVPTTSTNGMTFLQQVCPNVFGFALTGVTYSNWEDTDAYLINIMGTAIVHQTYIGPWGR